MLVQKYYKIKEIADMSGISIGFIRKSIKGNELKAIKTGKVFRVNINDFNHFLNKLDAELPKEPKKYTKSSYFNQDDIQTSFLSKLANITNAREYL